MHHVRVHDIYIYVYLCMVQHIAHKVLICVSKFSVKRAKIGKRTAGLFGIQCATRHYTNKNKFFFLSPETI